MSNSPTSHRKTPDALVLLGVGTIGRAVLALGGDTMARFGQVYAADCRPECLADLPSGVMPACLDASRPAELAEFLRDCGSFPLVANLTTGIDNRTIRDTVARVGGAYLDTACTAPNPAEPTPYSVAMPHTFSETAVPMPQFVCCGINPGMVELVARHLMVQNHPDAQVVDVGFYERDTFSAGKENGRTPVTWSPETLVDEVMDTPSIEVRDGRLVEHDSAPTRDVEMLWEGRPVPARLVGHEEVWHAIWLDRTVRNCRFAYSLAPDVMRILDGDDSARARATLTVPRQPADPGGRDCLVVSVRDARTGETSALQWSLDHARSLAEFGVNATQRQTALSVLLFIDVLADHASTRVRVPLCASTMPWGWFAGNRIQNLWEDHGIAWGETRHRPGVSTCPVSSA